MCIVLLKNKLGKQLLRGSKDILISGKNAYLMGCKKMEVKGNFNTGLV